MGDILVFAEHEDGKIKKTAFELLSKATELAQTAGGSVMAVCIGSGLTDAAPTLAKYGAKKVVLVEDAGLAKYNTTGFATALAAVITEYKPTIVLGSASALGKDLFPRLAAKIKAGLASDVVSLKIDGGKLSAKKPVYAGKALVDVCFKSDVQMATVRPNSFGTKDPVEGAQAEAMSKAFDGGSLTNPIVEIIKGESSGKADLTEAEIIVSGGRAMGSAENFKILNAMADVIGATVGASRAAVDSNYATHSMQVGQTGKVVNPKLYIACGISGAIQHLAGMRTSKVIVAINKDPEAPIFAKADYGIVGDLFKVVPPLTEELKKAMQ
ncbi:MAG: electron transfer flavoprotein subunit alpha/FixB family protein [Deltaproteobacteria bacterium]|nr:electron transfer flavoprotein subunit alpha/FixB family protein [Deltaproteobacteria bacterium]